MFKTLSGNTLIFCDYKERRIRIGSDAPVLPGFRGILRETASFSTEAEWNASPYAKLVSDELQSEIDWFWLDLESEPANARP